MTIRVLHVVLSLEVGGLENGVVNLINHQSNSGYQVDVICLRSLGPLAERIHHKNARVWFSDPPANSVLSSLNKVLKLCREITYDIIHSHSWGTLLPAFLSQMLSSVPIIVHGEHGTLSNKKRVHRIAQKLVLPRVDQVLSVSTELAQLLSTEFNLAPSAIKTIVNGVDTRLFHPNPDHRSTTREKLGFTETNIIIGTVGRLEPVKNYQELIEGFALAHKVHSDLRLLFVGIGELESELEKLALNTGVKNQVFFLGHRDDVTRVLNAMDVFALTSLSEGMSNSILEAMACGLPIIASNVGGNPNLVKHNKNGYLYPLNQPGKLAEYIGRLASKSEEITTFGQQSRYDAEQLFSINTMVGNYEQLYQDLVGSKSKRAGK